MRLNPRPATLFLVAVGLFAAGFLLALSLAHAPLPAPTPVVLETPF